MNGGECYLYNPEVCEGKPCPGNCDNCTVWELAEGADDEID